MAQRQRCRILGMGAANLDNVFEFNRFGIQCRVQFLQPRQQHIARHHANGDMHRSGERVVRGLPHVAVIIRVDRLFAAHHAAQHLDRAVRDHLIGVHIRLGARPGLPDHQREVVVELAVDHLLRGAGDGGAQIFVQIALGNINQSAGLFDHPKRANDRDGLAFPADGEIHDRALRLRAPVFVCRNFKRAKAVSFGAGGGHVQASYLG